MKLRIHHQSLRFRLSQNDVEDLIAGGELKNVLKLSPLPGQNLCIVLSQCDSSPQAQLQDGMLRVQFARELCQQLKSIDVITLEENFDVGDGIFLRIVIEKDFACLKHRLGPDDIDTFTHPNVQNEFC